MGVQRLSSLLTLITGLLLQPLLLEGQRTGFRGVATNLPRDFQYRDPETVSASIAVARFARSFQASGDSLAERNQRTPGYHQTHPKPKFVTRLKAAPGNSLDATEIFDFVDSRHLHPAEEHKFNKALDEVEIERSTSSIRLLPGEGLPPTPAPQLRPAFFPEGRHSAPIAVTPAPYNTYNQATPTPIFASPTPPPFIGPQAAVPAVPYAGSSAPYAPPKPALPPTPPPYLLSPDPYADKAAAPYGPIAKPAPYAALAPYVSPTPAPYVAAATPAPYVAANSAPYLAAAPAPYVAPSPAPYVAPAYYPKQAQQQQPLPGDGASFSSLINLGSAAAPALPAVSGPAPVAPPPPPPPPPPSSSVGLLGSAPSGGPGNYVFFSLNNEKLQ